MPLRLQPQVQEVSWCVISGDTDVCNTPYGIALALETPLYPWLFDLHAERQASDA
jgi:hypothetical protein